MSQNILECGPDMDNASLVDIITETLTATPASGYSLTISLTKDTISPKPMAKLVSLIYNRLSDIECSLNVSCLTSYLCIWRGDATVKFEVDWTVEQLQSFRDIMHFYLSLWYKNMTVEDLEHLVMLSRCLDSSNESKETKPLEKNKNQPSE